MENRRIRMVGGPNGSGKSTLIEILSGKVPLGYLLNPDEVERTLRLSGELNLTGWNLSVGPATLQRFLGSHGLKDKVRIHDISVESNYIRVAPINAGGYVAAILCDFIREMWIKKGISFTFETVMSDHRKLDIFKRARKRGYRTYLYYVCTETPTINFQRVNSRVQEGGHDVPKEKIEQRYERSLSHLVNAIRLSSRAFIFDNSDQPHQLVAEYEDGKLIQLAVQPPNWFITSVLNAE